MLIISFIYFSHSNRYLHHITIANNSDSASQLEHYCSCLSMCIYCCLTCGVKDAHWTPARVVLGYFHPLTQDKWAGTRWAWLAGRAALSLLGCDHEPWPTVGVGTLDHGAVNLSWLPCGPPCKRSQVEEICITTNLIRVLCFPSYYTAKINALIVGVLTSARGRLLRAGCRKGGDEYAKTRSEHSVASAPQTPQSAAAGLFTYNGAHS